MTEATAKQLADAMNRLAASIERLTGPQQMLINPGIHVYHHGIPQPPPPGGVGPAMWWPSPTGGSSLGSDPDPGFVR